jgi:N-acetylglucosamine-6-phosphate deacetylase
VADLVVRGGNVLLGDEWVDGDLVLRDGLLTDDDPRDGWDELDASGWLVAPGFVDLQCNGAVGIDLASEPERLWELAAALPRWGVTAWLPTIVTTPDGVIERALATLAAGPPDGWVGAVPLGLHLEGPFLAAPKRCAHAEALLRAPSLAAVEGWSAAAGVAMVTLAPELAGASEVIEALVERDVVVSLGHSEATATQASAAVELGAAYVTHLFNAMAPLHHREPGLAGIALSDDRLHVGMIVDGTHVHPAVVAMAQRALGNRLTLVTDAVGALGVPHGTHRLGRAEVTVGDDGVRLADGTLAGSNLSMEEAVQNLVAFADCAPEEALHAASAAPARLLGDTDRGSFRAGARADFVVLTHELDVALTVVGGEVAHRVEPDSL